LRIVVHNEIPDDPELSRRWNALALQMERPEVFYTCEWALSVQSAYKNSLQPLLLLGYDGDHLVGIASLAANRIENRIHFLASTTADYCDFFTAPHLREEFIDTVFIELRRRSVASLELANLPAHSGTPDVLRHAADQHGFHLFIRPAYLCAQVELGTGVVRQALKDELTGKKKLRRYLRNMEREGPVTFTHLQSYEQIQATLPEFAEAHIARFQATGRVSSLSTPERRTFLEELSRRFNGARVVTLSLLKINQRTVAWNFGFQFHRSWFWYQPTFDSRHEENSPGHCLLSRIVVEACDMDGLDLIDMGLGAEGYKERFGNQTRPTLHVTITRSRVRHLLQVARYRAASALKRSPKIESAIRRFLGR
jgi:CelD/BcsL family acetyltransferase involved in cellulose biosynthesis